MKKNAEKNTPPEDCEAIPEDAFFRRRRRDRDGGCKGPDRQWAGKKNKQPVDAAFYIGAQGVDANDHIKIAAQVKD